jgi:hypothetical protein
MLYAKVVAFIVAGAASFSDPMPILLPFLFPVPPSLMHSHHHYHCTAPLGTQLLPMTTLVLHFMERSTPCPYSTLKYRGVRPGMVLCALRLAAWSNLVATVWSKVTAWWVQDDALRRSTCPANNDPRVSQQEQSRRLVMSILSSR